MKKIGGVLLTLLLIIGLSGTGNATRLSDLLLEGGSIQSGDKLFTNWQINVWLDTAGSFGWANTEVTAIDEDQLLNPGLSFATNGDFQVADGHWLDVEISFQVTVLNPSLFINGVSLDIGFAQMSKSGDDGLWGAIAIGEDIGTTEGGSELTAFDPWVEWDPEQNIVTLSDSASFAPQSSIWVLKDILLVSEAGGSVRLDSFEQHFSQQVIPEPSTLLLLGAGLLALGGVVRRKKQ